MKTTPNEVRATFAQHRAAMQHMYRRDRTNRRALWLLTVWALASTVFAFLPLLVGGR